MLPISFEVRGMAAPQGSKTAFVRNGVAVMKESSAALAGWRDDVASAAEVAAGPLHKPVDAPVLVYLTVCFTRPARSKFTDYPAGPPDMDKLQRAIGDALTKSKVISDDARIVQWVAGKRWTAGEPFTAIRIEHMPPPKNSRRP